MKTIIEELKQQQHKSSTKKTYYKIWTNFNKFLIKLDSIPFTWEERLEVYCAYLIEIKRRQSSTVRSYISAIKSVLVSDGYNWNDNLVIFSSLTKSCKLKYDLVKTRLPIGRRLFNIFLHEVQRKFALMNQPYLEILYITFFLLAYYGLMRVGELADGDHTLKAIDVHQSTSEGKDKILIVLHTSKTHTRADLPQKIKFDAIKNIQFDANDKQIAIDHLYLDQLDKYFCPVKWIKRFLLIRGNYINEDEAFLIYSDGRPIQATETRKLLRECLTKLELNAKLYDIHSFRIGRATDLFKMGMHIDQIKDIGRWKSNAVYRYLKN